MTSEAVQDLCNETHCDCCWGCGDIRDLITARDDVAAAGRTVVEAADLMKEEANALIASLQELNLGLVEANVRLARESAEGREYVSEVHRVANSLADDGWVPIDYILSLKLGGFDG